MLFPCMSSGLVANGCLILFLVIQTKYLLMTLKPRDLPDVVDSGYCGDQSEDFGTDSLACTEVAVTDAATLSSGLVWTCRIRPHHPSFVLIGPLPPKLTSTPNAWDGCSVFVWRPHHILYLNTLQNFRIPHLARQSIHTVLYSSNLLR